MTKSLRPPTVGTAACRDYFVTSARLNRLFHAVLHIAGRLDASVETAHGALLELTDSAEERAALEEGWGDRWTAVGELKASWKVFLEMMLVRHVDNYFSYLTGLLFDIFVQRPETLRSNETINVETVLSYDTLDELIWALAARKVETLSYQSFGSLSEFFKARFSLLLVDQNEESIVVEAIETRNIVVHNRCIINDHYVARTGCDKGRLGQRRELTFTGDLENIIWLLSASVKALDKNARRHLKLSGHRFDLKALLNSG